MNGNQILIRADAGTHMGIGHLMRCLALAQAWRQTGTNVTFLTAPGSAKLENLLNSEGMAVNYLAAKPGSHDDAVKTAAAAKKLNVSWIVIDGYQFDDSYQQILKTNGRNLLFIDDYGQADHYYADLVLNQNLYADERLYANKESYTKTLLGPDYVLLGRHFDKWRNWQREIPEIAVKILVTLGGSDPENVTFKVIQALEQLDMFDLEVRIVVGSANPHLKMLDKTAAQSNLKMQTLSAVTDMPALMAWADIAITASGSTCWEIAYMGLPNCTIVLADNQEPVAKILGKLGVCVNLGWFQSIEPLSLAQTVGRLVRDRKQRKYMSVQGRSVISGNGSHNVVRAMLDH